MTLKHTLSRLPHLMPQIIFYYFILGLWLPNIITSITDGQPILGALSNAILPLGAYIFLASLTPRLGRSIWCMFLLLFLSAFNLVLLCLYGCGVIAVDMWLNLVNTNPTEVDELLSQLVFALIIVAIVYLPPLIGAVWIQIKKKRLPLPFLRTNRRISLGMIIIGGLLTISAILSGWKISHGMFPVNVIHNLCLAIERSADVIEYPKTSRNFTFNAVATHPDSVPEVVVLVIGETSRSDHWELAGYSRHTNPHLSRQADLVYLPNAMSESNTTHKSVPMLLTHLDSRTFDEMPRVKSIITAANEAGYHTAFFSNQQHMPSYVNYFSEAADTTVYLKDNGGLFANPNDLELVTLLSKTLRNNRTKEFIILHTYGSHFDYRGRYLNEDRIFMPDQFSRASVKFRPQIINAYDNSIVATDHMLHDVIQALEGRNAVMIFASDHGEDLYDDHNELFLHASPLPTIWQVEVPMLLWFSPDYQRSNPSLMPTLKANVGKDISTTRSLFHTTLQAAGISTPYFEPDASLLSPSYKSVPRRYINDHNECVPLEEILRR